MLASGIPPMTAAIAAGALAFAGCATPPPPRPPPHADGPVEPQPAAIPSSPSSLSPPLPLSPPSPPATPAPPPPPITPAPPAGPSVELEPPYKLGQQLAPRGQAELAELTRWNQGGRGDPPAPPPEPEGHPLPRVIVSVEQVRGPLKKRDVQQLARQKLWIKVVACYRLGAYKDPSLRGKVTVRVTASRAGKVTGARATASTMPDPEVSACLVASTKSLDLPRAKAGSTITATLQVSPGDDPMEPPAALITAGDGVLDPPVIATAAAAALPSWRACYEAALRDAPALWGRLAIRLHVTADGRVDEAFQTGSTFPDDRVVRCALRAARALSFPAPAGGDLRVVVPVRFSPGPALR